MAEEPDSLTLRILRSMDQKLDRVIEDVQDLKIRMTGVEEGLAGVNRRLDRVEGRLDRIEKRLDLVDHPFDGVRE
jgi:archaellum component FlaC